MGSIRKVDSPVGGEDPKGVELTSQDLQGQKVQTATEGKAYSGGEASSSLSEREVHRIIREGGGIYGPEEGKASNSIYYNDYKTVESVETYMTKGVNYKDPEEAPKLSLWARLLILLGYRERASTPLERRVEKAWANKGCGHAEAVYALSKGRSINKNDYSKDDVQKIALLKIAQEFRSELKEYKERKAEQFMNTLANSAQEEIDKLDEMSLGLLGRGVEELEPRPFGEVFKDLSNVRDRGEDGGFIDQHINDHAPDGIKQEVFALKDEFDKLNDEVSALLKVVQNLKKSVEKDKAQEGFLSSVGSRFTGSKTDKESMLEEQQGILKKKSEELNEKTEKYQQKVNELFGISSGGTELLNETGSTQFVLTGKTEDGKESSILVDLLKFEISEAGVGVKTYESRADFMADLVLKFSHEQDVLVEYEG